VEILATPKGVELVKSFYKITDGLRAVNPETPWTWEA
jgi:hypothetical protein